MSEADVNGPFSVVATEAEVQPTRRRPLKMVDEWAAMISSSGSPCASMVSKDSGRLNVVRSAAGDSCSVFGWTGIVLAGAPEEPHQQPKLSALIGTELGSRARREGL
jgi:hypothetical protein